eukprot:CAMPEP_0197078554 /NCGR_PEP_ID=MMETSP1384-20130603/213174_1 /TAXON_ID=29189 /ORGANISM="Ammonia sp." /LENGTH=839 /DNA_ID=CAMNT_0042517421 /DNA_START=111 /DNA_END=2630 /DNA_ORIENTATION=+
MTSTSAPLKPHQTLTVNVHPQHFKSSLETKSGSNTPNQQTPSFEDGSINAPNSSFPNTPVIHENLSCYSYTPDPPVDEKRSREKRAGTITPVFSSNHALQQPQMKDNYSNSHSNRSYHRNQNSGSSTRKSTGSVSKQHGNKENEYGGFPDTPVVSDKVKNFELDEIDEAKQSNISKRKSNSSSKKKKKRFSLMDVDVDAQISASLTSSSQKKSYSEDDTLYEHGYKKLKFIAKTLQGQTYTAVKLDDLEDGDEDEIDDEDGENGEVTQYVVKTTSKDLYRKGITITKDKKQFTIKEDIVAEAKMMESFMKFKPPPSLIGFVDFFEDDEHYFLVMEHGGTDFFDFVVKCHELISSDKLSMKEWRKQCKFIFAQMVQFIKWLHTTMNYCHLDISLENLLISKQAGFDEKTGKLNRCYVKFIDFGLSEKFDRTKNPHFFCTKYVGKTHYKAPKVYAKKERFCANKADIWSLGVCLFMMVIGAPPYNRPSPRDPGYRFIAEKKISKLLHQWERLKYVTPNLYDLMERMLTVDESKRITLEEIVTHPWLKIYFPNENMTEMDVPNTNQSNDDHYDDHHDAHQPPSDAEMLLKSPGSSNLPCSPNFPKSPTMQTEYSETMNEVSLSHSNSNQNPYYLNVMGRQQAASISVNTPRVRSRTGSYIPTSPGSTARKASASYGYSSPQSPFSMATSPRSPRSPRSNSHQQQRMSMPPQTGPKHSPAMKSAHSSSNIHLQHRRRGNASKPRSVSSGKKMAGSMPNTPTPIIQSDTSKHDHAGYYAAVADHQEQRNQLQQGYRPHSQSHSNLYRHTQQARNNENVGKNEQAPPKKKKKFFNLSIFGSSKKK